MSKPVPEAPRMNTGKPQRDGMYVAYVDPGVPVPFAQKMLLMYIGGKWGYPSSSQNYRGHVFAWIGPLPGFQFRKLEENPVAMNKKTGTSTTSTAAKALGSKGGKKGGPARAKALTSQERSNIASQGGKAKAANNAKKPK